MISLVLMLLRRVKNKDANIEVQEALWKEGLGSIRAAHLEKVSYE